LALLSDECQGPGPDGEFAQYTVTASNGSTECDETAQECFTVNQPVTVSAAAGTPDCEGDVTLTASASGGAGGFTYEWFDGGTSIGTGNPLTVTLAPGDHSITVTATDSAGCAAKSAAISVHVNQPVTLALGDFAQADCSGAGGFTATAGGGGGSYTFTFTVDGQPVAPNGNVLNYGPVLDGQCHTIAVSVVDSAGCAAGPVAKALSQCVVSTAC
jgi:hypothetical protein